MNRAISIGLITLLLAALAVSVGLQVWVLPRGVQSVVDAFPEVDPLAVPGIVWGVSAIACWQAIAVISLRIVVLARARTFNAATSGWLRAIVGYLLVFLALVVGAFTALTVQGYTTPGAMLGLIVCGLIAVVALIWLGMFLASRPAARYLAHA